MREPLFYRQFGYDFGRLPNRQLARLEEGVDSIEEARKRSGLTIGYPGWPLIYYLAVCSIDPECQPTVLETGTNHGCSTIVLAQAILDSCGGGMVHSVELSPDNATIAQSNVDAAGVAEVVKIHVGSTLEVLDDLVASLPSIDLAFLDGSHLQADVMFEFETVLPKLKTRGLVVFDNTYHIAEEGEDQRVYGALNEISDRFGGRRIDLPFVSWFTPGVAIWQREAPL